MTNKRVYLLVSYESRVGPMLSSPTAPPLFHILLRTQLFQMSRNVQNQTAQRKQHSGR